MATGKKIILIILDLLLLTLVLPMTWDYYNFMEYDWGTTTSSNIPFIGKYMTDYLFWGNIVLTVILILALIVILFYPRTYMDVQLTSNNGDLTLKKSAIEGFVGEKIKENDKNFLEYGIEDFIFNYKELNPKSEFYGVSTQKSFFKKVKSLTMDGTAIKTIARSNPFVLVLENGKIISKMSVKEFMNTSYIK